MKTAVILLSGGLDSATTLFFAKKKGYRCYCLIFDYGQRHRREIESAKRIAQSANCPCETLKINLPWKGSSLLDNKLKIPQGHEPRAKRLNVIPSTYVPARNIIFLSFALSFAEAIKAEAIFIGANALDYSGYPDCRPKFYDDFTKIIKSGTKTGVERRPIRIITPLISKTKAKIIELGVKLGVPYELTWSCYRGARYPCGKCDSCRFRAKGFRQAGKADPLLKIRRIRD